MKYILAIDQGTTGSRAVVYDRSAKIAAAAYSEFPQYFPCPGWVEHDPAEIWESVAGAVSKVLKIIPASRIEAIGITNQRETTIIWDEDANPLRRAIVWQCRRTAPKCEKLSLRKGLPEKVRQLTGLPIDPYFSATKIEWMLANTRGAAAKAKAGKLFFGTPDTWLLWKLTGGASHCTDYTNASRTMLFNLKTLQWEKQLLDLFSIPSSLLPAVRSSSGTFGSTINIAGLAKGIPISGIAGDQQAALFGQACFSPGDVKNTYGTGSFILLNQGERPGYSRHGLITTLGCGDGKRPLYVLEGSVFVAGSAIQWLRDGLEIISKSKESEGLAVSLKDNQGVYFVPALVGLGAPYWDANARGSFYGITRGCDRRHFCRAAIEAMAYQTRDILEAMKKDTGLEIRRLKVDGGASANNFLCQFQSDILGMDIIRPKVIETTSLGAAYLAGLATGYWKDCREIERCWKSERVFRPRMKRADAERYYAGWKEAVGRTLTRSA